MTPIFAQLLGWAKRLAVVLAIFWLFSKKHLLEIANRLVVVRSFFLVPEHRGSDVF